MRRELSLALFHSLARCSLLALAASPTRHAAATQRAFRLGRPLGPRRLAALSPMPPSSVLGSHHRRVSSVAPPPLGAEGAVATTARPRREECAARPPPVDAEAAPPLGDGQLAVAGWRPSVGGDRRSSSAVGGGVGGGRRRRLVVVRVDVSRRWHRHRHRGSDRDARLDAGRASRTALAGRGGAAPFLKRALRRSIVAGCRSRNRGVGRARRSMQKRRLPRAAKISASDLRAARAHERRGTTLGS